MWIIRGEYFREEERQEGDIGAGMLNVFVDQQINLFDYIGIVSFNSKNDKRELWKQYHSNKNAHITKIAVCTNMKKNIE